MLSETEFPKNDWELSLNFCRKPFVEHLIFHTKSADGLLILHCHVVHYFEEGIIDIAGTVRLKGIQRYRSEENMGRNSTGMENE